MLVLFLTDPAPDYLADQVFIGLGRVLGHNHVIDFPSKPAYHDPQQQVHYIPQVPAHGYREEDVMGLLRERRFDLAVLSSPRAGVIKVWESLHSRMVLPPTVLIDGEDDSRLRTTMWQQIGAAAYFKRELRVESGLRWGTRRRRDRLYPLPLSVVVEQVPQSGAAVRDLDVSYAARVSHPKRKQAADLLAQIPGIRFEGGVFAEPTDRQSKLMTGWPRLWAKLRGDPPVTVAQQGVKLPPPAYYDLLARSKMALCVRGGGYDTLRYWEVPATHTLLLAEQPDIEIPDNFVHGEQALFFKPDLSNLADLVQTYANDERRCKEMARKGHEQLLRYHTCERRAAYLLDICRRIV